MSLEAGVARIRCARYQGYERACTSGQRSDIGACGWAVAPPQSACKTAQPVKHLGLTRTVEFKRAPSQSFNGTGVGRGGVPPGAETQERGA